MTETKITQLSAVTTPYITDVLPIVTDPTGTPATNKVQGLHLLNPWLRFRESCTYVSATSFTIPGDYTTYFTIGTKIKLYNNTTKYGYVLSSSYSSPNTTVNLVANSTYSLANASITSVCISYASPYDFPTWFNYASTLTGGGGSAGSYAEDVKCSKYCINGRNLTLDITKKVTNVGSWTGNIYINFPVASSVEIYDGSSGIFPVGAITPKALLHIYTGSFQFEKQIATAFLQWSELGTDWIIVSVSYPI